MREKLLDLKNRQYREGKGCPLGWGGGRHGRGDQQREQNKTNKATNNLNKKNFLS